MPLLSTLNDYVFCPRTGACGNGVNLALWNEFASTTRLNLYDGVPLLGCTDDVTFTGGGVLAVQNHIPVGYANIPFTAQTYIVNQPLTLSAAEFGFELLPGFEKFRLLTDVMLPAVKISHQIWNLIGNILVYAGTTTFTNQKLLNLRFTIKNIEQNTEQVIAHYFTDENFYNNWCAQHNFATHTTPAQFVQTIGVSQRYINWIVDIPSIVAPIGNNSEVCRLKVELMSAPMPYFDTLQGGSTFPDFTGAKSIILKEAMLCQ